MKIFIGKVISKKMEKTATVSVERVFAHPRYKKRVKRVKKYQVHDEVGTKLGDNVRFVGSKPYSKLKRWRIVEVVDKKKKKGVRLVAPPNATRESTRYLIE